MAPERVRPTTTEARGRRELIELTPVGMGSDVDVAADLAQARRRVTERKHGRCAASSHAAAGDRLSR